MPKNLANLSIDALNDVEHLQLLQEILAICLEELDEPSDSTQRRIEILIGVYLPHANCRLNNLQFALKDINNLAMGKEA